MFARAAWASITAAWAGMEFVAVKVKGGNDPAFPPFTYFLREIRGPKEDPQFWALLGVWAWLGYHVFLKENQPRAVRRGS